LKQIIIDILNRKLRFEFCKKIAIFCEIKIKNNVRICRTSCTTKKKKYLQNLQQRLL